MNIIPFVANNYKYAFVAYGYYNAISGGMSSYYTGRWIYDKGKWVYRKINGTDDKWETVENMTVINPRGTNLFIIRDDIDGGFTLIDRDEFNLRKNYQSPSHKNHTSDPLLGKPYRRDSP